MSEFDVRHIVPSSRDLLRVLSTRRNNLAIVAEIGPERPAEDAVRLDEANVSAMAFAAADQAMLAGSGAIRNAPSLCLSPVTSREDCQRARFFGADGVCLNVAMPAAEWDALAKVARAMRMLPVAVARTGDEVAEAVKLGARAIVLRAGSVEELLAIAGKASRRETLVADVAREEDGARIESTLSAEGVRALAGKVDSVVVPPAVHLGTGFDALVAEVDP